MKLVVKDYNKDIKGKVILDNINLEFKSGKIYGFYGRNGSGKTMLFRAISTLIRPSSGDVLVDGKSILNEDFDLSKIGILIEDPGFYSSLTGYDNLEMLYRINNKKNKKHLLNVLDLVGLINVKDKKYKEYSLGMKQRLRIAQAIMEDQKIIILDEPTNGLDESGINDIRDIIFEEKKKDKLILIASHNKEDLKILCDVIYKLDKGKVVGDITKEIKNDK